MFFKWAETTNYNRKYVTEVFMKLEKADATWLYKYDSCIRGQRAHGLSNKIPQILQHLFRPTRRIHVWYIYLHLVDFLMVNVGKYTIFHGCNGLYFWSAMQTPASNISVIFLKVIVPLRRSCGVIKPPFFTWEGWEGFLTNNLSVCFFGRKICCWCCFAAAVVVLFVSPPSKRQQKSSSSSSSSSSCTHLDVCFCNLWLSCTISTCVSLIAILGCLVVFVDDVDGRDLLSLPHGSQKFLRYLKWRGNPEPKKGYFGGGGFYLT